jgi:biopolymer transport protein ExbB/TolQ
VSLSTQLLSIALLGAEWVLWLLVVLSFISVMIIVERAAFFFAQRGDLRQLTDDVCRLIREGQTAEARTRLAAQPQLAARVALAGLDAAGRGTDAVADALVAAKAEMKMVMERNLAVLGTLGSNAPFIGLFGTVIGIIQAFHNLAHSSQKGPAVVMESLSEALVATAVGLLVAIPAVIAFNYFQRRMRAVLMSTDALTHSVLSHLHRGGSTQA